MTDAHPSDPETNNPAPENAITGDLYDYPAYYDLVYGSDWKAEFDFLQACFQKHGPLTNRGPARAQHIFEPACGTGRLLFRLGKAGFRVSGLDLNPKMVDYCNRRLHRHDLPQTCVLGDMTDFQLAKPVDAAFNMINSFRHLTSETLAAAHLDCVARALRQGGLYVLGLHLTPGVGEPVEYESWSARRGHLAVVSTLQTTSRDLSHREERFGMSFDVYTPTRHFRLENEVVFRTYTVVQFTQLIERTRDLEIVETYDFAYDIDTPILLDDSTEDAVFVLRKRF